MRVSWEEFAGPNPGSSSRRWGLPRKMGPLSERGRDDCRPPQDGGLDGSKCWSYVAIGEFRDSKQKFAVVCGAALINLLRIRSFVAKHME